MSVTMPKDLSDFDAVCAYVAEVMQASLWRMCVVPRQVKKVTDSDVMLDDESQQAELYNTNIGRVVTIGDLAWKSETSSHLRLSEDSRKPGIGDWVVFYGSAAFRIALKGPSAKEPIICFLLQDTDVIAVSQHPEQFRAYI